MAASRRILQFIFLALFLFSSFAAIPTPARADDNQPDPIEQEFPSGGGNQPPPVEMDFPEGADDPTPEPPVVTEEAVIKTAAEPAATEAPVESAAVSISSIALSKNKGAVGTSVKVTITDYPANANVVVKFDSTELAKVKVNASGDGNTTVEIPNAVAGSHKVVAAVGSTSRSLTFTITPRVAVSPRDGIPGASVTIKLSGYGKSEAVDIFFAETKAKHVSVTAAGSWSGNVTVPSGIDAGKITVAGTGTANTGRTTFTISETTTPTPTPVTTVGSLAVTTNAQAGGALPGACYTLYKSASGKRGAKLTEACDAADGADGVTNFAGVPTGSIVIAETTTPAGYLPAADSTASITTNQAKSVTVVNELNSGLTILNFDEKGSPLPGACFIVYTDIGGGSLGNLVASACDEGDESDDGVIHFTDMRNGALVLVEKVVPRGYARVAKQTLTFDKANPVALSIQHEEGGAIVVTKLNDLGDPVNGACFDAYIDLGGGAIGNFVDRGCNPDGNTIVVDGLPIGNYYLVESKAPVGYKAAANQKIAITSQKDVAVTVVNLPTTKLVVRKQNDNGQPLKGACFEVYKAKGQGRGDRVQASKCDNADGKDDAYMTFNLSPGNFILAETTAPKGYLKGKDTAFTINPGLDTDVNVTNLKGGSVQITTLDALDNEWFVSGACYTIWTNRTAQKKQLGAACDNYDGAKDGVTTVVGLPAGTFFLQQSTVPFGYFAGTNFDVTVELAQKTEVEYFNEPWPLLIIHKVDENGDPLGGACFTAFVDKGGGQRGTEWKSPDGPLCDKDGDGELAALVTPGNQILVETKSPIGYLPVQDTPFVMIRGEVTELTVENFKTGVVYVTKKSQQDKKLTGACFELYHDDNGKRGSRAAKACDKETSANSYNKTADGITILNGLEPGSYWLVESTAPGGYFKAPDTLIEVTSAKTEATVIDEAWPVLTITKVDDLGKAVKGACFQLFKIKDGKRDKSASSQVCATQNNIAKIGAAPGTYLLGEVKTPSGFVASKDIEVTYKRGVNGSVQVVNTAAGFVRVTNLKEGDAKLIGSCFEIWTDASGKPGKRVDRECDSKYAKTPGIVKLEAKPGNYILVQGTTPSGYKPAANQKVTLVARQTLDVTVKNEPYPRLVINSVDGANKPLPGACFDLYEDGGSKLGKKVVTAMCDNGDNNNDGTTSRRLKPGRYVAREVTAPADYAKTPDFRFTIVAGADLVLSLQHQLAGILVISTENRAALKIDSACYELWTKLQNGKKGILVAKMCDKDPGDSSSKADGITRMKGLPPGSYLLVQSFAKSGYLKAADQTVVILGGSTTNVKVINDKPE